MLNTIHLFLFSIMRKIREFLFCRLHWRNRRYAAPSPIFVKRQVLLRNSLVSATWVETGTFLGETTEFLSKYSNHVVSIEPEPSLFKRASNKFSSYSNIRILYGTSEEWFPKILPELNGPVNFWLDGHYSDGITFKGDHQTPILFELQQISKNLFRFTDLRIFIDDLRCFGSKSTEYQDYPSIDFLVDWARQNQLTWHIEHDIFIAFKNA